MPMGDIAPDLSHVSGTPGKSLALTRFLPAALVAVGLVGVVNAALGMLVNPEATATTDLMPALAVLGIALVGLGLWVACAVTFLVWLSQARTLSDSQSAVRPRHRRTFAIWCWFIPIAGFIFGWRVIQDLWTATDPSTRGDANAKPAEPRVITVWLAALVASSAVSLLAPRVMTESSMFDVVAAALLLVSAVALARIVTTISKRQTSSPQEESLSVVAPEATG